MYVDFKLCRGSAPLTLTLFKDPLYLNSHRRANIISTVSDFFTRNSFWMKHCRVGKSRTQWGKTEVGSEKKFKNAQSGASKVHRLRESSSSLWQTTL